MAAPFTPIMAPYDTASPTDRAVFNLTNRLRQIETQFLEVAHRWGDSFECVDEYTQGHCERVADLACQLARDAGLDEGTILWFRIGALLHDVGKITVPPAVLNKPDILTPQDIAILRRHAAAGEALVADVDFPWDIRPMIRHHHERWDGAGYPDGLAAEEIPVAARVLCIADVFDALTSSRVYRPAYTIAAALRIMSSERGGAFDPWLLDQFMSHTVPLMLGDVNRPEHVEDDVRMIA
jgi:putative nucleotidyltransferase with HDIG domain